MEIYVIRLLIYFFRQDLKKFGTDSVILVINFDIKFILTNWHTLFLICIVKKQVCAFCPAFFACG